MCAFCEQEGHLAVFSPSSAPHPDGSGSHFILRSGLVNGRSVTRFGDGFAGRPSRFQPDFLSQLRLFQGVGRSFPESRTGVQVWNIRDIALVRVAIENVDVIILHGSSSSSIGESKVLETGDGFS